MTHESLKFILIVNSVKKYEFKYHIDSPIHFYISHKKSCELSVIIFIWSYSINLYINYVKIFIRVDKFKNIEVKLHIMLFFVFLLLYTINICLLI